MRWKRVWFLVGAGAFTLSLMAATVYTVMSPRSRFPPDDLRAHATRVADTKGWATFYKGSRGEPPYLWRNNHEILHYVSDPQGERGAFTLALLDTRSGATRLVQDHGESAFISENEQGLSISPDGSHLLCLGARTATPYLFTLALDGSGKRCTWPVTSYSRGNYWEADSRSWVRLTPPLGQMPGKAWRHRLDPAKTAPELIAASALPPGNAVSVIAALRPSVYLLYNSAMNLRPTQSQYSEMTLPPPGKPGKAAQRREIGIAEPPLKGAKRGASFGGMMPCVSPQGDRLLWVQTREAPPRRLPFWERFMQRLPLPSWMRSARPAGRRSWLSGLLCDVWVSGMRGERPVLLGVLPARVTEHNSGGKLQYVSVTVARPAWSPDGKQIAFWQNDALYVAPVPPP